MSTRTLTATSQTVPHFLRRTARTYTHVVTSERINPRKVVAMGNDLVQARHLRL